MKGKMNIFKSYPDCLDKRNILKGLLLDIFPEERKKVNLVLQAYDEGIADDILKAKELDVFMQGKWKKLLIMNYGISPQNAEWVVDYWFSQYGVAVEGKKYTPFEEQLGMEAQARKISKACRQSNVFVDVSKLKEGDKLPKHLFTYVLTTVPNTNISSINCVARRDGEMSRGIVNISIKGEYEGKFYQQTFFMIMVYNSNNELLNFSTTDVISKDFDGEETFSRSIEIPDDELISNIVIRLVKYGGFFE